MEKYRIVADLTEEMYYPLLEMIKHSFEEHLQRGLQFTCSNYNIDDLKQKVLSGKYLVALSDKNEILGITSYSKHSIPVTAYENITAISPAAKGMGLGSKLIEIRKQHLIKEGYSHLLSDTAVKAKSSVNWHLKKCGCHIIGYESYSNTNYYSYVFIEDIEEQPLYIRKIKYPLLYFTAFIRTRICKKADGNYTFIGKALKSIFK